jgi:hypothetical protein
MRNIKKIFQFSSLLGVCIILIGQSFAFAEDKFTKQDVEKFLIQARDHALVKGKEQALKDFMDPKNVQFRKGSLYVFAQDYTGVNLAHIKPSMVGSNMMSLKDQNDVKFIEEMTKIAKISPKGGWVEYMWQNPATKKVEKKYTFALKVDDSWWIGAGIYESERK